MRRAIARRIITTSYCLVGLMLCKLADDNSVHNTPHKCTKGVYNAKIISIFHEYVLILILNLFYIFFIYLSGVVAAINEFQRLDSNLKTRTKLNHNYEVGRLNTTCRLN